MEDWPGGITAFQKCEGGMHMALFVGIDVSKEKFDACGYRGARREGLCGLVSYE